MHKWWARRLGTVFRMLLIWSSADEVTDEETVSRRFYEPVNLPDGFTVLDPFMGSGTTAIVAMASGRDYLGIELNPAYVKLARDRIAKPAERQAA